MENPKDNYWRLRLAEVKAALEQNNFAVFLADSLQNAAKLVKEKILPEINPKSLAWGGSMTFMASGLYQEFTSSGSYEIFDPFEKNLSAEENLDRRRRSLLADLFFTSTNAITETGLLVNLDMMGNRVGALSFGPRHAVVLAGRNKVVPDVEEAMARIKNYAAPVNAMRLDKKTPCVKTGFCEDCSSPDRICNTWTIIEKSFPKERIKIILINEDLGL